MLSMFWFYGVLRSCGASSCISIIRKSVCLSVEMNFVSLARSYIKFFYLFGQSLYPMDYCLCTLRKGLSKWHRFALMIPSICMFAAHLALCIGTITLFNIHGDPIKTYYITANIYFFCELIKIFAISYRNFTSNDLMGEMLRNFQMVELLFRSTLQSPISFTSFKRAYAKKLCYALGSYAILIIFVVFYRYGFGHIPSSGVMQEVMKCISIIMQLHIQFYIDLVSFYLKHLNTIIAKENSERGANDEYVFVVKKVRTLNIIRKLLLKYKLIHFRLKKTADQLNEYFGWMLLLLTMQSFIHLMIYTEWQIRVLTNLRETRSTNRKITLNSIWSNSILHF